MKMHCIGGAGLMLASLQTTPNDHVEDLGIDSEQWRSATVKADTLIALLDVSEKAALLTGNPSDLTCGGVVNAIPRVNFSGLCLQDGPSGIRTADRASVFPAAVSQERALGKEFRGKGAHVVLGSTLHGPPRTHPLGGRNWEGFSVDPYLAGVATSATVRGIQDSGVQACTKHYIGNEQETQRTDGVINGVYVDAELGFPGYVMSDWLATHSGTKAVNAGLDMTMPGPIDQYNMTNSYFGANLVNAVRSGNVSAERLDDRWSRFPNDMVMPPARDVRADHGKLIRRHGAAGTVLKNINNALPLKSPRTIAVFGNGAADISRGSAVPLGPTYAPQQGVEMGVQAMGRGSGSRRLSYVVFPLDALRSRAASSENEIRIDYAAESMDRLNFEADWNSTAVVNAVASYCPSKKTVVITHSGGINTMPWAENPNVTAILAAHYLGQEEGSSIVDILFGDINPSGHLPYTIARNETHYNTGVFTLTDPEQATDSAAWQSDFSEGLLIDYRHFDARNITPLYEFDYGLSYTTFDMARELSVRPTQSEKDISLFPPKVERASPGGNPHLWKTLFIVSVTVMDTGDVAGAAGSVPAKTPVKVLRGFEKVYLEPGEERKVLFPLVRRDMSYWDVGVNNWRLPKGEYTVSAGFSSRDLKKQGTIQLVKAP
ncbi:glycoside hydrolase superfamily [Aspergillus terricola var. indicus]